MCARTRITGATGRLGRQIAEAIAGRGDEIVNDNDCLNYLVFAHRYRGEDSFQAEMDVNLRRVIFDVSAASWGVGDRAIVLISSIDADSPNPNQSLGYNISKAGLNQFARYYAKLDKVRINCVSPATFTGDNPDVSAVEVANVVLFLCSDKSTGINGQNIKVTGRLK